MKLSIDELWISMRTYNVLKKAKIETIQDLTKPQNWQRVLTQKGCGKLTIIDIAQALLNAVNGQLLKDAAKLEKAISESKRNNRDDFFEVNARTDVVEN